MAFNVLLVDDSSVMRGMILRTLKLTGIPLGEIHQAGNGQEGLGVLEEHWVDLALVDINMPVMNGEEMIERVRQDPVNRDLAIIVVSTESSETRIERIKQKNVEFVHKPFTAEELRQTILRVTGVDREDAIVAAQSDGAFDF